MVQKSERWHWETNIASEVVNKIADGMEEVSADIAMIELLDTPLEEYVLLLS